MNLPLLFQCLQYLDYDYLPKLTGDITLDESMLVQQRWFHGLDIFSGVSKDYDVCLMLRDKYLHANITYGKQWK